MKEKQIIIAGAGGIGSWLALFLKDLFDHQQLDDTNIVFADDDSVDIKNVSYQNFSEEDILETKVEVIRKRYGFGKLEKRLTDLTDLTKYDLVVSAVDNTHFRKMIFENEPNNTFDWIDLRSEGTQISVYTKGEDKEKLLKTVAVEAEDKSCQREWELSQGIVHNGNKIVAAIGAQYILNWYRGDMSKKSYNTMF